MNEDRIREEPCGCRYDAGTDIYVRFCEEHDPANRLKRLTETPAKDFGPSDTSTFCSSGPELTPGLALIAAERRRQIDEEGWTPEHDRDWNSGGQLARAAACYALHDGLPGPVPWKWPFADHHWKPGNRLRDLVKAGALIAAEIDRLIREGGREDG